ncbi:hypothetical protein LY76DRAFT_264743 [Colletotrichum caudatum]|nr:hypothetical protein LY76DRAFT_264743 [Colletotrichum caudatum]
MDFSRTTSFQAQIDAFSSSKRSLGGSSRPSTHDLGKGPLLNPPNQPCRASSSKFSNVFYSRSNPSDQSRAQSSTSSCNGMEIDTDSYEDSSNSYDDTDCECTEVALQVLEEVAVPPVGTDWNMAENTIFLLKNNISRCLVLAQCRACRQESGICMLNLVIYEKLTTGFEEVAQWWRKRYRPQGVRNDSHSRRERHHNQQQQQQQQQKTRITMGKYQIDTAEEHQAVFATIIVCQLRRLAGLSMLMTEHSKKIKWQAHVQYGEGLRRRMMALEDVWKFES